MTTAIVTGASGLVGSEAVRALHALGLEVHGVDTQLRERFFGAAGSTRATARELLATLPGYRHHALDVRDVESVEALFARLGRSLGVVVHCAAQPSHEWSLREPATDWAINAGGTLVLLEALRKHAAEAVFLFTSTNKVYGDHPNRFPLEETETRLELPRAHAFHEFGIDESLGVDGGIHTPFGASKLAADVLVQEYARSFDLCTVVFRCGCIAGAAQAATELHGFLGHLVRCAVRGRPYTVYGHGGKQVRDVLHARDLARAFTLVLAAPRPGAVYNLGGGRGCHTSLLEAAARIERITGRALELGCDGAARLGDHRWWVTDTRRFRGGYPDWEPESDLDAILTELVLAAGTSESPATPAPPASSGALRPPVGA